MLHLVTDYINAYPCFAFTTINTILTFFLVVALTWKHLTKKNLLLISLFQIAIGTFFAIGFQKAFLKIEEKPGISPSSIFLNAPTNRLVADTKSADTQP